MMDLKIDKNIIRRTVIIIILLLIFTFVSPIIFTRSCTNISFLETGQIGDTIGGIMSPFIALIAVVVTYSAFVVQYKANQIQIKNYEIQNNYNIRYHFEITLHAMLNIHRDNVKDCKIQIQSKEKKTIYEGQDFFNIMIEIYNNLFKKFGNSHNFSEKEKTIFTYLCMFYGASLEKDTKLKDFYQKYYNKKIDFAVSFWDNLIDLGDDNDDIKAFGFGHMLSRYYRYQFQIIKFIDKFEVAGISDKKAIYDFKYQHAKNFRSHLSNNEQLLLYYNSLSPLGKAWNDKNYIKNYKLVKNIFLPQVYGYNPVEWAREDLHLSDGSLSGFFEFYQKV